MISRSKSFSRRAGTVLLVGTVLGGSAAPALAQTASATQPPASAPAAPPNPAQPAPTPAATPAPVPVKATPAPPPDVKAYFDKQVANSKDNKFHMTVNGKDLALTPFHVWPQRTTGPNTTSMMISMRSDQGTVYDIDFATVGAQITSVRINRINGESIR